MIVVDSPPGMTSPSSPSSSCGIRTSTASAPSRRRARTCSRNPPCSASTPILSGLPIARTPVSASRAASRGKVALPAADLEAVLIGQGHRGDPDHRLTETGRDLGKDLRVLEVRRRLDNRTRPPRDVVDPAVVIVAQIAAGLEDPRAD